MANASVTQEQVFPDPARTVKFDVNENKVTILAAIVAKVQEQSKKRAIVELNIVKMDCHFKQGFQVPLVLHTLVKKL